MNLKNNPKNFSHPDLQIRNLVYLAIGSALGLGLSPVAPGTLGALLGVLIHLIAVSYLPAPFYIIVLIIALLLVSVANHLLTPWAREYWGSEDPRHFVLDEIAGYLMVPILFHQWAPWKVALGGFVLFRFFDIVKIPPARQIDRNMKNSWGILLDDLVSGAYAALVLYALWFFGF